MIKVGIIDYGAGNIASVEKAIDYIGAEPRRITVPEAIFNCDRLILPGVGAAGEALQELQKRNLIEALNEAVQQKSKPFLGICLGMQLLGNTLHEFGQHQGLGWIPGSVVHLKQLLDKQLRIPHMGWSKVTFRLAASNFSSDIVRRSYFYFAHSYTLRVDDPQVISATVNYGIELVAAVKYKNIFATQFHPEKSQIAGNHFLQSFLQWSPE